MAIIPPEELLEAYSIGIFPMAEGRHSSTIEWYTARKRGIIPLSLFKVSKNVMRVIRQERYTVKIDRDFTGVIKECANRSSTWISDDIIDSYSYLHELGYAHSVEVYRPSETGHPEMAGGLYGVSLRAAFFGESLFQKDSEASKVALFYCHKALLEGGFMLWDTQFYTEHLAQFGCIEIPSEEYHRRLKQAMSKNAEFDAVDIETLKDRYVFS